MAKGEEQREILTSNLNLGKSSDFSPLGETIFNSIASGVVIFDSALKITKSNVKAGELISVGDSIDGSLSGCCKDMGDWTMRLKSVLKTQEAETFNNVNCVSNGKTGWLRIRCKPFESGGILLLEDITKNVNLEKQLADTERLATIGKLVSKVTHELNNPMDGILRYLNLAIRTIEHEELDKPKEYLLHCREGLMRMIQIVSELLEFSRGTYYSLEQSEIEQLIDDAIKTMEAGIKALKIVIERNYSPERPKVKGGNLFQVFCNLIKNAIDSMPDGGQITISTSLQENNIAVIEIKDTGTGFASENIEAIFEPFFTTKDMGKGTGLGLAICKDIIERYHGRITAENAPQGGSIFTVYLPTATNL
ncbi:MAG: GHKL domain-containing protein [Planctomycetes bacterium]|nr:GHKL domain-containing protein [Planctomycetota bacterium]